MPRFDEDMPDDRREDIALKALALFLSRGYSGTSMSMVAKAAGIRKASLYHHFASKEALFLAALSADVAASLAQVDDLMKRGDGTPAERFRIALGLFYDAMVRSSIGALTTVISETAQSFPAVAEGFHDNFIARFQTTLVDVYQPCVAAGSHRDLPETTVHDVVFGPLLSIAMTEKMFGQTPHVAAIWSKGRSRSEFVDRMDTLLRSD